MGRRSNFDRAERDFYPTPPKAVTPLVPHIADITRYEEPCAGNGALISVLKGYGKVCSRASDIEPQIPTIKTGDATHQLSCMGEAFITNPPWSRDILHKIIERLSSIAPTYLLFDAAWAHTQQSAPYMHLCKKIISVGRIKWIENSPYVGKEDCAWYQFDKNYTGNTIFVGQNGT